MEEEKKAQKDSRRRFLHLCMGGMGAVTAGAVTYPVVTFLGLPKRLGKAATVEVPLASLKPDTARYFDRDGVQVVVIFTEKVPKVFDAACTHLGCITAWDPNNHVFKCPCHGAVFDDKGNAVSGPVNKPLRKIPFTVKDGKLVIS